MGALHSSPDLHPRGPQGPALELQVALPTAWSPGNQSRRDAASCVDTLQVPLLHTSEMWALTQHLGMRDSQDLRVDSRKQGHPRLAPGRSASACMRSVDTHRDTVSRPPMGCGVWACTHICGAGSPVSGAAGGHGRPRMLCQPGRPGPEALRVLVIPSLLLRATGKLRRLPPGISGGTS